MGIRTITITENGVAAEPRPIDPDMPLITYGPTLARRMSADDARTFFAGQDERKGMGWAHIVLCQSHLPNTVEVNALFDELPPAVGLLALHIVDQRIRHLHNLSSAQLDIAPIENFHADVMRQSAEDLVDLVRGRDPAPADMARKPFHLSREEAISAVMIAMATSPITPRVLVEG